MPDIEVLGVVNERPVAEQVVGNLRLAGFPQERVSMIMVKPESAEALDDVDDQTGEGAAEMLKHVATGAGVGSAIGAGIGLATLAIPGVGPAVGIGALVSLFTGGAAVGGLTGAFTSETVSEEVIERYGMALREGQAIICVTTQDAAQAKQAEAMLTSSGATNVNSYLASESPLNDEPGLEEVT